MPQHLILLLVEPQLIIRVFFPFPEPQWLFVDRLKNAPLKYAYGSQWCSLTLNAVKEIVDEYGRYRYMFEKTTCSDELYKQMILAASKVPFRFAREGNLRYVRFEHRKASPRILSMNDYEGIIRSGCVFARKFQEGTEVFEKIYERVHEDKIDNGIQVG